MLDSMMINADHGANLGGWQQSENAQRWNQDGNSFGDGFGVEPTQNELGLYLEVADQELSNRSSLTPGRSITNARPKRRLFDMNSPGGVSSGTTTWKDPTQNPAEQDEPISSTGQDEPIYSTAAESMGLPASAKEGKKTLRRKMSFFNKGGKSRAKLSRDQLKWAEAERQAENAASRPEGSMPRSMARPAILDDQAGVRTMAAGMAAASKSSPGGMGQDFLRKTGVSMEEGPNDAQRKQQWFENFNNNTVWDNNEEKWIYQKTDAWMSWGLAPREFVEPIYEPLDDVLGSDSATNHTAAASSVPISEFDLAAGKLVQDAQLSVVPPLVPSTLTRAPLSTLNRGAIKAPTMTVVNAGGGGLVTDRILDDRPLGRVSSISGHFDPTGHSGYLSMRPEFPAQAQRPTPHQDEDSSDGAGFDTSDYDTDDCE